MSDLRDSLREAALDFAWGQWTQLGVAGQSTRTDVWALDPEALLLFTVELARRDPRLFDEMLDWMALNGQLLSLQRLGNLTSRFPIDAGLVDSVVAWVGHHGNAVRWPKREPRQQNDHEEPLFDPKQVSRTGEPDPFFARHGYLRPSAHPSGKSSEPEMSSSVSLAFRLRLLFGQGTRAEIIRVLLTIDNERLDASRIADEAGFAKRNVNEALTALTRSGVIQARWTGNQRRFLLERNKWADPLGISPSTERLPRFVSWVHLLPAVLETLVWLERQATSDDTSDYLISSRARYLIDRITPDLEAASLKPPTAKSTTGAAYLPVFEQTVKTLTDQLA